MRAFVLSIVVLCYFLPQRLALGGPQPVLGRFSGVFRHEKHRRDQLAKLDFILSREEGNTLVLKAVLTLHFGDFRSAEYVSYHFDSVKLNVTTGTFIFDQADQPITLIGKLTGPSEFVGEFRSVHSDGAGTLRLNSDHPVTPELPLMEPVWGEYRGKCRSKISGENVETVLQLHTYRSKEGAGQVGNSFRSYKVKGFLGEKTEKGCLGGAGGNLCIWGNVRSASYNFFENQLFVYNSYRNLSCSPQPEGLKCDGCDFLKRASPETAEPRMMAPVASVSAFQETKPVGNPALAGSVASLQGSYRGYVHHEYLDIYQPAQLSVLTYQDPSGTAVELRMSAVGTLYFGGFDSPEAIAYRFQTRSYVLQSSQFVFDNSEPSSDTDAILQVTTLGNGVVRGVWFSRLFGRVGDFELRKGGLPSLPGGARKMELVSGHYQGGDWELDILVGMGTAEPNTENPFAPLTFDGWTKVPGVTGMSYITGGSYDFYTGKLGLEVGENSVHLGQRESRETLLMKKMYYSALTPMPNFPLEPYRLTSD